MTNPIMPQADARYDLVLERVVDVPPERVWAAWTVPAQLMQWYTPVPWRTIDCEIDLRPGGIFRTIMQSPGGQQFPNVGCYLEVVEHQKLVWTSALGPGYRPAAAPRADTGHDVDQFFFTVVIALEAAGSGTRYTATVLHADAASRQRHEDLGFHQGWSAALDQLVAMIKAN